MEVAVEAQRASLSHQPAPPYTSSPQTHASEESEPQPESRDRHQDEQTQDQPLQNGIMPTLENAPPSSATHSSATETESSAPDRPVVETLAPVSTETTEQSVNTQVVEVIETPAADAPVVNGEPDTMETDTAANGGQAPADGQIQSQNENTPVNGTTEQDDRSHPRENEEPSEESSPSTASDGSTDSSESTERTGEDYDEEDENDEPAYWAEYKEDTSVAEGDELKEIESGDADHSAHEYDYIEKSFYHELDDPEYKPIEKARITWKITGIRGTKEKPNRATIIRSPPAYIGGYYWTLKFFPRGNSVGSLSVYLECSPTPPVQDKVVLETEFRVLKGAPDAVLSDLTPDQEIKLAATVTPPPKPATPEESASKNQEKDREELPEVDSEEKTECESPSKPKPDFRISAQIGVVLYNPEEPRTGWTQSSCHQFNSHNFDWGWTHFHGPGPWNTIHLRQHGQRQALLRNDTLCFDAYIRLFDDPTKSLWWHSSDSEPIWDSYSLVGLRPMGDVSVNYCQHTAGLVPWLLLTPFRDIVKSIGVMDHLDHIAARPKPVCEALQVIVHEMTAENIASVRTEGVRRALRYLLEGSGDVVEFWERLRRSLQIELAGTDAIEKLASIFDSPHDDSKMSDESLNMLPRDFNSRIRITSENTESIQCGVTEYLKSREGKWSLPPVLQVELARQKFDKKARQWKFLVNRVHRNEELDLSNFVDSEAQGKYTLFSFIAHKGHRTSRWYYPLVRPGGQGTHWLAFKGEDPYRIECLTAKTAAESYEGLDIAEVGNGEPVNAEIAVAFIYIRNDLQDQFLTPKLDSWTPPPAWHRYMQAISPDKSAVKPDEQIPVAFYGLNGVSKDARNPAAAYDVIDHLNSEKDTTTMTVPVSTTVGELRAKLAAQISTEEKPVTSERIRMWTVGAPHEVRLFNFSMEPLVSMGSQLLSLGWNALRIWVQILNEEDVKYFSIPEFVPPPPVPNEANETKDDVPAPPPPPPVQNEEQPQPTQEAQPPSQDEDVEMNDASPEEIPIQPPQNQDGQEQQSDNLPSAPEPPEHEMSDNAPDQPETNGVEPTPAPEGQTDEQAANEAIIASIIAQDLALLDESQEMDTSEGYTDANAIPPPPPAVVEEVSTNSAGNEAEEGREAQEHHSGSEDSQMEGSPIVESRNNVPEETNAQTSQEEAQREEPAVPEPPVIKSDLILPCDQVYYFVQEFDADRQTVETVGAFFARSSCNVREEVRKTLGLSEDQGYNFWSRRKAVASVHSVSSSHRFRDLMNDVGCIIFGKTIPKRRQTELVEAGCFLSPDRLLEYLWAVARQHPIKSFTGKKTVEAILNGEYYSGDLCKGYYHGSGTHISEAGDTYSGDFVQGRRQGTGTIEHSSGDTYTGDWFEDQPHGQGTWVEHKTGNKYVGGYRNGKRHGKGVSYWEVADEEMNLCQICYTEEQDSLFYTCGHVCACGTCARQVEICPVCREKVISVVKIFRC
ncbi:MATH and UCH domain-containing protein [Nannizzia gypsea CBS 118893]|uniref:MATH and UCH domain-containing protein n=1 Tax=Arthroderma gypseum (strain ATCC MYA-4604 / CBS 118893) TaxID=535722 RepID=E4UUY3_ARTGP|nr:MATH and UCH domain-containing protein [Nannizzia gypsea CBS 118893]EFR01100.1 MATH and UCH domain-containing protein [Nannizzia gypsea CBS 118893]